MIHIIPLIYYYNRKVTSKHLIGIIIYRCGSQDVAYSNNDIIILLYRRVETLRG